MYVLNNNVTYFDSFAVEHIPIEIKKLIDRSTIVTNIFRILVYDQQCVDIFVLDLLISCLQVQR